MTTLLIVVVASALAGDAELDALESEALWALLDVARDETLDPSARVSAASTVLERVEEVRDQTQGALDRTRRYAQPVLVVSGDASYVELIAGEQVFRPGDTIPAGRYDVYARFADQVLIPAGTVTARPDEALDVRCAAWVQMCRGVAQ